MSNRPVITFDFETRSEADLKAVGAWAYSEHPSTEVICACWGIGDEPIRSWDTRDGPDGNKYTDLLFDAIRDGAIIEAHNVAFERSIWTNVCTKRMGWPLPADDQWADTMAVAAYYALPLKLDALARALGYQGKDADGGRLISRYSKLHLKTAKREIPDEDIDAFVRYCTQDVKIEQSISDFLGDLPDREQAVFALDQTVNLRGIHLDLDGIENATAILEQRAGELEAEFVALTGVKPTQNAKIMEWAAGYGIVLENLQKDYLNDLLDGDELGQGPVRQALRIRLDINKASTKKLDAMARQRGADGRARFQVRYHGALTGRWTGTGFQPLNLNRGYGDDVEPDDLVAAISHRDPKWLDCLYGSAMDAVAKASRHWIQAQRGNKIVAGDFVSIEAVLLACLAGEQWKIEAFAEKKPIYEMMACKIHGLDPNLAIELGKKFKEKYPYERQDGKTCLGASTWVLTNHGVKRIIDVLKSDLLWDGLQWVPHEGLLYQGTKEVIDCMGIQMTPDHLMLAGARWFPAAKVASQEKLQSQVSASGTANLPFAGSSAVFKAGSSPSGSCVPAALTSTWLRRAIFVTASLLDATAALRSRLRAIAKNTSATLTYAPTTGIGADFLIASPRASRDAERMGMKTTEPVASVSGQAGEAVQQGAGDFWRTFLRSMAGITRRWRSTVSTWTSGMSLETCASTSAARARSDQSANSKAASPNLKPVYDLVNAGPNRRFTILTNRGFAIVHNCELAFGYQGALGAWLKFDDSGRHTDEAIIGICKSWRGEHPMTTMLWRELEKASVDAVMNPGMAAQYRQIGFEIVDDWLSMILPNGKRLWYFKPQTRLVMPSWHKPAAFLACEPGAKDHEDCTPDGCRYEPCARGTCKCQPKQQLSYMAQKEGQWKRVATYGGKLAENATQATSREVLVPAMLRAEKAGYPIIMSVYDEIVAEVAQSFGSAKEFAAIMAQSPGDWARAEDGRPWPISVDAWEGDRYRK